MSEPTDTQQDHEAAVPIADVPTGQIQITRTELVWPGKYNPDGTRCEPPHVNLPFQVIETINESRATREGKKGVLPGLFDIWEGKEGDTFEAGWKNKLIYTLDYGTYVDLLNTSKEPQLDLTETSTEGPDSVVPFDDKRSIRRIVLTEATLNAPANN